MDAHRQPESPPAAPPRRARFPRSARVLTPRDFRAAFERGRRCHDERLVIWMLARDRGDTRLGLNVRRQFGTAPQRNRFKRLVRAAFRLHRAEFPAGVDILVAPRGAGPATLAEAVESLTKLVERAGATKRG